MKFATKLAGADVDEKPACESMATHRQTDRQSDGDCIEPRTRIFMADTRVGRASPLATGHSPPLPGPPKKYYRGHLLWLISTL